MDQKKAKELNNRLREMLILQGHPVAVKMLEKAEDIDNIQYKGNPVRRLEKNLIICQLFAQARFYGRVLAAEEKHLRTCRLGGHALGFDVTDFIDVYDGTYFTTTEAARRMMDETPQFEKGKYKAMLVASLDRIPVEPDVVILFGNAAQMLRIVNGVEYNQGGRMNFTASGDAGLCADIVVEPMRINAPHIAIPCNGGRIMSLPNETDLACGIPYSQLESLADGLEFTARNVPVMYPTAWQHVDWELPEDAFIRNFLRRGMD